jgi:large subunit ribosomal protein L25
VSTRPQLAAAPRSVTGKKVSVLRRQGILPAVLYGHGHASEPIQLDAHDFEVLRRKTARNALVDLKVGDRRVQPVLLQGIAENPVSRKPVHVDFYVVKMTEELTVDVPIVLVGEASAVEKLGGMLMHQRDIVSVRALPGDLPVSIELDISSLVDFEATLHVSDLTVPQGVTIVTDGADPVARVTHSRGEEAVEAIAPAAVPTAAEEATASS